MHPMANPSASVSARRRGEMPWRSHMAVFRFIDSGFIGFRDLLVIMLTLSVVGLASDHAQMKLR
jgi:hypothetical protein